MKRLGRHFLFSSLISEIRFDRALKNRVSDPVLYEIIDRFLEKVCNSSTMVVMASGDPGFGTPGQFGRHEPWPQWADRHELILEGLMAAPAAVVTHNSEADPTT